MVKILRYFFYSLVWCSLIFTGSLYWAFWIEPTSEGWIVKDGLIWDTNWNLSLEIMKVIVYFLWFLWLIAVIWGIKWWFQILTAADNEERVKKGKKTVLFMLLGVFIILIAYAIVSGVTWWLSDVRQIENS